jgi:CRISPR-associated exonuclease Cas4
MNDLTVNIREIQHFMYCPRRYALLKINTDWKENAFVVKADIMHEHVHDGSHSFSDSRKKVRSAIQLYNDLPEYDLYGVADCIEFIASDSGVKIDGFDRKYKVRLVEYKPKAPKGEAFHETDAIQVFAQKLCADYVWKCSSEAYIYYADTRKRVELPFEKEYRAYDTKIKELLAQMREINITHEIPLRKKGQKCSGCSLSDLCFPKDKKYCVKDIVMSMKGEEDL